ncbi:MAG: hypothetical protein ACO3UN_06940 [Candidatus Puniceispirillaceae bacterium]
MAKKSKKTAWAVVSYGIGYVITRNGVECDKWGQPIAEQPPFVYRNAHIAEQALAYIQNAIRTDEVTVAQIADDEQTNEG